MLPDRVSNPGPLTYESGANKNVIFNEGIWEINVFRKLSMPRQRSPGSSEGKTLAY